MTFWLKKHETSKHHDLASKRQKSRDFRGLEFPRMSPDPPTCPLDPPELGAFISSAF